MRWPFELRPMGQRYDGQREASLLQAAPSRRACGWPRRPHTGREVGGRTCKL
jgi:hypothetical protein